MPLSFFFYPYSFIFLSEEVSEDNAWSLFGVGFVLCALFPRPTVGILWSQLFLFLFVITAVIEACFFSPTQNVIFISTRILNFQMFQIVLEVVAGFQKPST